MGVTTALRRSQRMCVAMVWPALTKQESSPIGGFSGWGSVWRRGVAKWAELFHFDECVAAPRVIVEAAFGKGTHVACGSLPGCVIFCFV